MAHGLDQLGDMLGWRLLHDAVAQVEDEGPLPKLVENTLDLALQSAAGSLGWPLCLVAAFTLPGITRELSVVLQNVA